MKKELKVEIAAEFNVPAEQLFEAWTKEDRLKQWWKPMGHNLESVENDLRQGGKVKYNFSGSNLIIHGEYIEVSGKQKLSYTWNWELPNDPVRNASYALTVEFDDNGNGSKLKVLQENFEDEESLKPHREGWEKGLQDLKSYLLGGASASNLTGDKASAENGAGDNTSAADSTGGKLDSNGGYMETPEQAKVAGG